MVLWLKLPIFERNKGQLDWVHSNKIWLEITTIFKTLSVELIVRRQFCKCQDISRILYSFTVKSYNRSASLSLPNKCWISIPSTLVMPIGLMKSILKQSSNISLWSKGRWDWLLMCTWPNFTLKPNSQPNCRTWLRSSRRIFSNIRRSVSPIHSRLKITSV